jgi:hypothetical protein
VHISKKELRVTQGVGLIVREPACDHFELAFVNRKKFAQFLVCGVNSAARQLGSIPGDLRRRAGLTGATLTAPLRGFAFAVMASASQLRPRSCY